MLIYSYYAAVLVLGFLALFFGFKTKQAAGAAEMNELSTSIGRGSFGVGVKSFIMRFVWGVLCLGAGWALFTLHLP